MVTEYKETKREFKSSAAELEALQRLFDSQGEFT